MNTDYAKQEEANDYELYQDFNEKLLKLKDLGRAPEKFYYDASGITTTEQYISAELKRRYINLIIDGNDFAVSGRSKTSNGIWSGKTIVIEAFKYGLNLADAITLNHTPLYVNFLNNNVVIVFNLQKITWFRETQTMKINSKLYDGFEIAKRIELDIKDAYIYKKENNQYKLIYKPSDK